MSKSERRSGHAGHKDALSLSYDYHHRVSFHETDTMGVVHHSNYIKYFEEARVAWLRERDLVKLHQPLGPWAFAVIDLECRFLRAVRFEDELVTRVEGLVKGLRLEFLYAIWCKRLESWVCTGHTTLVPLDVNLKPTRLPAEVRDHFGAESWSETWPPSRF